MQLWLDGMTNDMCRRSYVINKVFPTDIAPALKIIHTEQKEKNPEKEMRVELLRFDAAETERGNLKYMKSDVKISLFDTLKLQITLKLIMLL